MCVCVCVPRPPPHGADVARARRGRWSQFWGLTPAVDVAATHARVLGGGGGGAPATAAAPGSGLEPLRVLLVEPGDPRHILKTVSQRRRAAGGSGGAAAMRPLHVRDRRLRAGAAAGRARGRKRARLAARRSFTCLSAPWRCSRGTCCCCS